MTRDKNEERVAGVYLGPRDKIYTHTYLMSMLCFECCSFDAAVESGLTMFAFVLGSV